MKSNSIYLVIILLLTFYFISSCRKEYSYEGGKIPIISAPKDSTKIDSTIKFPLCSTCDSNQSLIISQWSFRNYTSFLCGKIDKAFFNIERDALTFFGPSNCSTDTVLSISASFYPIVFDSDKFNITSNHVIFYYNANNVPKDIFKTEPQDASMTIVIDSFIHSTGIITGRIFGYTFTKTHDSSYVNSGKFKFKLN